MAPTMLGAPYLPLSRDLLVVAVGVVAGYLARPEGDANHSVGTSYHQKRQEVDQDGHAEVIPRKNDGRCVCPLPIRSLPCKLSLKAKCCTGAERIWHNSCRHVACRAQTGEGFPAFTATFSKPLLPAFGILAPSWGGM